MRLILWANSLLIEDDSFNVMDWIQPNARGTTIHFLLQDIQMLLWEIASLMVRHVYHEANSVANLVAIYIARHFGDVFWIDADFAFGPLEDILFSDLNGYIHIMLVRVLRF